MTRSLRPLLLLLVLLLLFGVPQFAEFYTDWLWFGEVGFQSVYATILTTKILVGLVVFALAFALVAFNLHVALRMAPPREFRIMTAEGPRSIVLDAPRLRPAMYIVAGIVALIAGLYASSQWDTWLAFRNATPFGQSDPIFGRDVGFYVFTLPFYGFVRGLALALVIVTAVAVAAAYAASGGVSLDPLRGVQLTGVAMRHLAALGVLFFLLLSAGAWLARFTLLTTPSALIHGATYADIGARLPMLSTLVVASIVSALLAAWQLRASRRWYLAGAALLYVAVNVGGNVYAALVQRFIVAPNEQVRETPFIIHNIGATRRAFALENVEERELSGDALLSRADLEANAATLRNVPLWDHQPLLDTFGQIQEIRTYYDFVSVHNDRYRINGEWRQIMLSARELNSASLPNRTWINERLTFTHGYGITLGPVNQVTTEGLPVLFIRDLPPVSTVDLKLDEPSIYFGELPNDHVFVNTKTKEFHYPKGDDNVYAVYTGKGGVRLEGLFRTLLFAIRFRSAKVILSDDLTADSRVMYYRRVPERVRRIAPFLTYEEDRYLSIADGRLYWVQDAYTTTDRYPYSSEAADGINYIRNSVKVTVDAYDGTTTFYVVDDRDPIATTLGRMFPGLLRPLAEMPEGLRTRLRYPQGIFLLQTQMFSTYHMTNPAVFYNKEDQWEVPALESGGTAQRMQPWYTIMRLPGEKHEEFIQMLPFTPRQKDNLAAWMVAKSDGGQYGQMVVFQFPKQKVIFGPRQVQARINQDQVISPQITLWNQQGSEVIQGNLLVIPIEESLLYIRPLYLRAAGGRIPELKRVIVAYHNRIVMDETLDQALNRIFPPGSGRTPAAVTPVPVDSETPPATGPSQLPTGAAAAPTALPVASVETTALAAEARATYERAIKAQREGDWARYGEEIKRLGELLGRLEKATPDRPQ